MVAVKDKSGLVSSIVPEEDPIPTPGPEKIIVVATPTPDVQKTQMNIEGVQNESGGCGGGSSSISIFSVLVSILIIMLYRRSRKEPNSVI